MKVKRRKQAPKSLLPRLLTSKTKLINLRTPVLHPRRRHEAPSAPARRAPERNLYLHELSRYRRASDDILPTIPPQIAPSDPQTGAEVGRSLGAVAADWRALGAQHSLIRDALIPHDLLTKTPLINLPLKDSYRQ